VDQVKPLRVAVIGTGFWGRNQARVFANLNSTKLVAVCDANSAAAKNVGTQFNVEYDTDANHLLSRKDIDAVTICTPTTTHKQIAERALMAGKHVMVEKPMTNTVLEAQELLKLAEQKELRLMPGHIERFNPPVTYLRNLLDQGKLGKAILLIARRVGRWPERIGDVGVVRDTAIHDIDLARYILKDEVSSVYARTGSMRHSKEDYAEIMLQFKNGGTAFIDANWLTPRKARRLIVTGSEATVQLDYITQELWIEDAERVVEPSIEKKEPLTVELNHFAESILNDRPFTVNGIDGLRAVEICEAVLQSGSAGKTITLPARSVS
jgi:UDP-N-acetylglucosamine 3-dehydrogenase